MLGLVAGGLQPLDDDELLVKTSGGQCSRFRAPTELDEGLATLAAFVLADGYVGRYDRSWAIAVTRTEREDLLDEVLDITSDRFGVSFAAKNHKDYVINDSAFALFFSELLGLDPGRGRNVRFPAWVLNATESVKRAFVSTFLSLDAEIGNDRIVVTQANEMKIEQLSHLLLSFGIFPARGETEKAATNTTDPTYRTYHTLTIRGKADLGRACSAFDIDHPSIEAMERCEIISNLERRIENLRSRNLMWVEVTEHEAAEYSGRIVDLSVPDVHNFVGGRGGLYLHNTLAAFTSIIDELYRREREGGLDNTVYCLYISPLKSLANDIHRNLEVPLSGITERGRSIEIRHAIRHGDTPDTERQQMLEETPHILNTTPETLAILLDSPKFKEKLRSVEYVVVDEIHSLAENKRGTHLSVSLERLEAMCDGSPTRIGCSATVEPLETMARFLVGCETPTVGEEPRFRDYEIVDTRFVREFDLELICPTDDLINTPAGEVNERFYDRLHRLIGAHTNTLVFTNTRSGAERVLHNLRERAPDTYDEENSGCHHGSLSKAERQRVEEGLKEGSLDVVTTSTSLELGIDMPYIDLVVQVGSPKSVAALLQRVGRAGHQLGRTVTGRVVALDRDELVECAVMVKKAEEGFVDRVFVPENAHDVAAQHVYGMAINAVRPEAEVKAILRRAYPYRSYGDDEWESLLRYLTADYDGLEEKNVYAKVWRDTNDPPEGEHHYEEYPVGEALIGRRGRMARVIYMTNVGTIPDSFDVDVFVRSDDEWVGQLDEGYLDTLEKGDVFVLGGSNYEYRYRRGTKAYVDPTGARPTVPSWFSERLPLSYDLGREILEFQRELLDRLAEGPASARAWLREFPMDDDGVRAVVRMFDAQLRYAGPESVATDARIAIEEERDHDEYRRRYYVHSVYGRRFNDGFSRLLAHHVARETSANVGVAVADNGFTLSVPLNRKVDIAGLIRDLDPDDARADLRASLENTDLLKRYFRINATRSLMILKRYKGYEKSAAEQQVSSEMLLRFAEDLPDFAVMEETYREILEDKLNVDAIEDVLGSVRAGDVAVSVRRVDSPTPRAFGLATLMAADVVLAEDESEVLREFHRRVQEAIDGDEDGTPGVVGAED
jgi:ATP-dependent Lhr-like helicase